MQAFFACLCIDYSRQCLTLVVELALFFAKLKLALFDLAELSAVVGQLVAIGFKELAECRIVLAVLTLGVLVAKLIVQKVSDVLPRTDLLFDIADAENIGILALIFLFEPVSLHALASPSRVAIRARRRSITSSRAAASLLCGITRRYFSSSHSQYFPVAVRGTRSSG